MDKFLCKSARERNEIVRLMAETAPDNIKRMASELTAIKNVGYLTAIEILIIIGRYALKGVADDSAN